LGLSIATPYEVAIEEFAPLPSPDFHVNSWYTQGVESHPMLSLPRSYRLAAAWICIFAIAVLSLLPKDRLVRTDLGGHFEHILAYTGTALAVAYAYGAKPILALRLIAYAGILELLQRFSPGRTSSIEDFACSAIGVLLGGALFMIANRVASMRRTRAS
jgi:VanZ family protein